MAHFVDLVCPRCKQIIDDGRSRDDVIVCNHCGYTQNHHEQELDEKHERHLLAVTLIGAILAIAGFIHFVQWDQYAFEIIPLKIEQWTHQASAHDLRQIADICRARLKYECTETALTELVQKDQANPSSKKNLSALFQLADLQRQLGQSDLAMANFKQYFSLGGTKPAADFSYAKLLDAAGFYKNAQVYYQRTLLAKPGILQITVIQHYVAMLMKIHEVKHALSLIRYVRNHTGPEGETFMAREYNKMTGQM